MEKDCESKIITPDAVITDATNYANDITRFLNEEFMEQLDLDSLIKDVRELFELYSSNDERFLNITKRIRGDEILRFIEEADKSKLIFDDGELKNWLRSNDDAVIKVIVGELARRTYESLAERFGESAILENIKHSQCPESATLLMKKTKDNFMFFLENLLKQRLRFTIQTVINMAKERMITRGETKRVIKYLN